MLLFTIEAAAKAKANKLSEWMHALSSKDRAKFIYASKRTRQYTRDDRIEIQKVNRKKRLRTLSA